MPGWLRVIHPAPALAVVLLSAALATILAAERGGPLPWEAIVFTVLSVAGSQVITGATNDVADRFRDAAARPEKPIPAGDLSVSAALWVASIGLALQLAASLRLGPAPLLLGAIATGSAVAYNTALSRTPFSVVPYLVSFGILPFWIATGVGVEPSRVVAAAVLVAPFAGAAHLANTVRDWEVDADAGSRSLAQVIGRERSLRLAVAIALAVGLGVGAAFVAGGEASPVVLGLGGIGLLAVAQGARDARRLWYGMLVAAVCWTAAWALATG